MTTDYDFVVIGGGSAGYAGARTAAALGLRTLVVDGGPEVGGLCILRGCMPSKTLIESANRFLTLRHADEFGLFANDIGFDAEKIISRKRRLIGEFADFRRSQLEGGAFDFLRGRAEFLDSTTVQIRPLASKEAERTVTARTVLLATGSVVSSPPVPGLAEAGCLTSDDVLELTDLPRSIIVLGAGPVALELAHYFSALGSEVTIIQRSGQLLRGVDEDVAAVVESAFRQRGADVFTNTRLVRIEHADGCRRVTFIHDGEERSVTADAVLNALGRSPNTAGLGLAAAQVETNGAQIIAKPTQQTTASHVFAAGDCCGPFEVVHTAIEQGEIAARNAARLLAGEPVTEEIDFRLKLFAVFTEPQVASVGQTEHEARDLNPLVAKYPFDDHGKSIVMGETLGFVKLIAHPQSREILGGAVVGPHASDLIHEVVVAMRFRATASQLAAIPHYHPTLSEIWTYPASEIAEMKIRET